MRKLPTYHTFFHRSNMPAIDLAEKLLSLAPVPMSKVWFANSGSEANDHMIKFVWFYNNALDRPEKKKIIARHEGYHGIAVSSASLTETPPMHKGFDLPLPGILHTGSAHYYRPDCLGKPRKHFRRDLEELEALILKGAPGLVAAFVAEPVMVQVGVRLPRPISKIQTVLKKYDILMVQTRSSPVSSALASDLPVKPTVSNRTSSQYETAFGVFADFLGMLNRSTTRSGSTQTETEFWVLGSPTQDTRFRRQSFSDPVTGDIDIGNHVKHVSKLAMERLDALNDRQIVGDAKNVSLIGSVELVKDKETKENFGPEIAMWPVKAHAVV